MPRDLEYPTIEPWLGKRKLADHFDCSVRSIERMVADGMPHAIVLGRVRIRASEAEAWLEASGRFRRGDRLPSPQPEEAA